MPRRSSVVATGLLLCATVVMASPAWAQRKPRFEREAVNGRDAVAREVLVKFRDQIAAQELLAIASQTDALSIEPVGTTGTLRLRSRSRGAAELIGMLSRRLDVVYAEPNHIIQVAALPDDPRLEDLWGLDRIQATAAWDVGVGTSSSVVVGVIDTGIDYTHPDLAANMWSAPSAFSVTLSSGEITCAAGTHGFNAITRDCDPMDDHNHGTHVSGTIGAHGNNGVGVVGVNWNSRLMGIKFLDEEGSGSMADAIASVEFAIAVKQRFQSTDGANIRILSNSWGGSQSSQALLDQINAANDADMLFVVAAGNNGSNNDIFPFFPAAYSAPNMVTVAASTFDDSLTWFSNYGRLSVHLAAPGDTILSTTIGNTYTFSSGTSMATPHVSGAAALVLSLCDLDTATLRESLLGTVDYIPDLVNSLVTGGRLNVNSAVHSCTALPGIPSVTAIGGDTRVTLTWSPVLGAIRYVVQRGLTSGGPYTILNDAVMGSSFVDTGVVNDTTYFYVVAAENTVGRGSDSTETSATPQIPSDLAITLLTTPSTSGADVSHTLPLTITNQGAGAAPASIARVYLSPNNTVEASDVTLTNVEIAALAPGASHATSASVVMPSDTTTGRYYLIVVADADNLLFEVSESNNRISRSVQIGPDLSINGLTVPTSASAGSTISVTDLTRNTGGGAAGASATSFYLSTNSTFSVDDVLLGSRAVPNLGAGTTDTGTTSLTIPHATTVGSYYILAVADAGGTVAETLETNNTGNRAVGVGGDLVVSSFTAPVIGAAGGTIVVTDTVRNQGSGAVAATTTRFYISSNATLDASDQLIAEGRAVDALEPGVSHSGTTTLTLPTPLVSGAHFVIAKADGNNEAGETSEINNWRARYISIGGDLTVSELTAPSTAASGADITVTDTTSNQGAGNVAPTTTRFYLSANTGLDGTDTPLGTGRAVPELGGGANSTASTTLTLPTGLSAATYYIIASADSGNTVSETSESNNTRSRAIQIGGDLVLSAASGVLKAAAGGSVSFSDTVTNTGGGTAPASTTRYYLSTNGSLSVDDLLLGGGRDVPSLNAGGVSSGSTTVFLPASPAAGVFSIIVKADGDGTVGETSETNNTASRQVAIGPDLIVSASSAPSSVVAGSNVNVNDTVTNQGGADAPSSGTRFYLSSNTSLDGTDIVLEAVRVLPVLAPGSSSAGTTVVAIPATTPPAFYYLLIKTDGDNVIGESYETNNLAARAMWVTAAP